MLIVSIMVHAFLEDGVLILCYPLSQKTKRVTLTKGSVPKVTRGMLEARREA